MRADQLQQLSDGVHDNLAFDGDQFVPTVEPDWNELDRRILGHEEPEQQVDFSDMVAALSLILGWICASPDLRHVGARAASLLCMIDPVHASHGRRDLTAIAKECGVTKQAASKWLCDLRDQTGVSLTVGKKSSMRARYRQAQIAALEKGTHGSFVRKAKAD